MAIDLTGGIDPAREYMFAERPSNPEMRDSVSFWVFDDRGQVGLPRVGVEAVASNWAEHSIQVNVAFPDGRVYRLRDEGRSRPVRGTRRNADGAGWRSAGVHVREAVRGLDDDASTARPSQTSSADLAAGRKDGPLVDLRFEVEATLAVPPWVQGALQADAASALETSVEGDLMGGDRYEQLFRATGSVRVAGRGAPVHRQRPADPAAGRAQARGLLGALLAVGAVPERPRVRLHRLSAAARRPADLQRGLPLRPATASSFRARVVEAPWLTPAAAARRGRLGRAGDRRQASSGSRARRCCRRTTSPTPARCRQRCSPRWPTGRSLRFSRPACATGGTARRPTACSSARARWTRSLASVALRVLVVRRQLVGALQVGLHAVDVAG